MSTVDELPTIDLRPRSMMFPTIDGPARRLVDELERRGWRAPGVVTDVRFRRYALGNMVDEVEGDGWRVEFGRPQGVVGRLNDVAALDRIVFGDRALSVYEDYGMRMTVWVGPQPVPKGFSAFSGMNERLDRKPRTVLLYQPSVNQKSGHYYEGRINPYLANHNEGERLYDPREGEPTYYRTDDVLREMGQAITAIVERIVALGPPAPACAEEIERGR